MQKLLDLCWFSIQLCNESRYILREKCPYSEFIWSVLVRMRENMEQKNSEYGHFSCNYRDVFLAMEPQDVNANLKVHYWVWDNDEKSFLFHVKSSFRS